MEYVLEMAVWKSKLLENFSEISHGFLSSPYSFVYPFKLSNLPSYLLFMGMVKTHPKRWVIAEQVHGNQIYFTSESKNLLFPKIAYKSDALITHEKKRVLIMFFADCIPIFIYIPKIKLVGLVHSGWRGTIKDFPQKVIMQLKSLHNISASDIYIGVGPSIHSCCFEVKEDFIIQLPNRYKKFLKRKDGKFYYALIDLLREELMAEEIPEKNIDISDICTFCNKNFFSHRRDRTLKRNIAFIYLKR
ncbi:MAG TPA: polyphenol oxidase family protein [Dictyoglomaceae bacterium]|nr:polyphenol oxidase family protein [Dictyoglomaceae bacterium]